MERMMNVGGDVALSSAEVAHSLADRIAQAALAVQIRARAMGRFAGSTAQDRRKVSPREVEYLAAALEAVQANINQIELHARLEGEREEQAGAVGRPSAYDLVVQRRADDSYVLVLEGKRACARRADVLRDLDRLAGERCAHRWFLVAGTVEEALALYKNDVADLMSLQPGDATGIWEEPGERRVRVRRESLRFHCGPSFVRGSGGDLIARDLRGVDFAAVYSVAPAN